jgi:hypothetical protein
MTKPSDSFAAFVSPVAGRLVRRFGTGDNLGQIAGTADVDPSLVIPITHEEWRRHQHEYLRAIGEESLKRRTAGEWEAAEAAAHQVEVARVDAIVKKAEEAKAEKKRQDDALVASDRKAKGLDAPSAEQLTTKKGSDR